MPQKSSLSSIPDAIRQVALSHHLGAPQAFHEMRRGVTLYRWTGISGMVVGGAILIGFLLSYNNLFSWWPAWQMVLVPLIGCAWIGVGLWIFTTSFVAPRLRVCVFEQGIIYATTTSEVLRWRHMERVWMIFEQRKQGPHLRAYVVRRSDDMLFEFPSGLPALEELGKRLQEEVTRYLFPRALKVYESGHTVRFEEIAVNQRGISVRHERKKLAWPDFAGMSVHEIEIQIFSRDETQPWATLKTAQVPNISILKGLVEYIQRQQELYQRPAISAYLAGQSLQFGELSLSQQGISVRRDNVFLPWQEIITVGVGEQQVMILRKSGDWYILPTALVQHVVALKEVLEFLLQVQ